MANDDTQGLRYLVTITHKERGTGFVARDALQKAQKQKTSPIIRATFSGSSTNSRTDLEVLIDDSSVYEVIKNTLSSHGRLSEGSYTVESIELIQENPLEEDVKRLRRENGTLQRRLNGLREDYSELRKELEDVKSEITTPLDGLLAYFKTQSYAPSTIFDDSAELDFALSVLNNNIENTIENYVNHMLNSNYTEEKIEEILDYQPKEQTELKELKSKYDESKKHLDYLEEQKNNNAPSAVLEVIEKLVEDRGDQQIVEEYESYLEADEKIKPLQGRLKSLKGKHQSFSEHIDLINEAGEEIPVIFQSIENGLEICLPFQAKKTSEGFVQNLAEEIKTYFSSQSEVTILDQNHFVGYRVENKIGLNETPNDLINEIPVTLKTAGFNKILPYRLG